MHITILTLFPQMFRGPLEHSILKRATEKKLVTIDLVNIRDFAEDSYKSVDGHPYGGGVGMILRVDVVDKTLQQILSNSPHNRTKTKIILLDPHGTPYHQEKAEELSRRDHLVLIAGHYEGFDERIRTLVDEEISIGDYVLTGGEIPAMVLTDSIVRLIPGVLSKKDATAFESFSGNERILEYPQYTVPVIYKNTEVPKILLSGDHAKIAKWRTEQAKLRTAEKRPDLMEKNVSSNG